MHLFVVRVVRVCPVACESEWICAGPECGNISAATVMTSHEVVRGSTVADRFGGWRESIVECSLMFSCFIYIKRVASVCLSPICYGQPCIDMTTTNISSV